MLGLKEGMIAGITGAVLLWLASRFFTNIARNSFDFTREECCITCRGERSRRARSYKSRKEHEEEEEEVDGSVDLHPCNHQVVISVNAPPGFQLSLDFLPCFQGLARKNRKNGWILGSSNGLLLCSADNWHCRERGETQYYLCNPLNNHWIALPPTPKSIFVQFLGFVFDPCTNFGNPDRHQPLPCSKACRFKVLRMPIYSSQFEVEIFSSDIGQWSRTALPSPNECPGKVGSLFHNGYLHWLRGQHLVVYDPYNNKLHGLIPPPRRSQLCQFSKLQGPKLSSGSIWLFQLSSSSLFLRCWELTGYDLGDLDKCYWRPHRLCDLTEILGDSPRCPTGLAIHPHDPDVVYLEFILYNSNNDGTLTYIASCNLRTKVMGQPMLRYVGHKHLDDQITLLLPPILNPTSVA